MINFQRILVKARDKINLLKIGEWQSSIKIYNVVIITTLIVVITTKILIIILSNYLDKKS